MSEPLPDPLVPAEVDLRDFAFMPLDVLRLRDSDLSTIATGDEFKAAVLLWCAAWHQVPAASVPNDDRWLARHSGAGPAWRKVRAEALRGFVECSDGRLYHPVVAEKALESWQRKQSQRERTRLATEARQQRNVQRNEVRDVDRDDARNEQRNVVQGTGTGTGTGKTSKATARASRLPADWQPPLDWLQWAMAEQPTWNEAHARKVAESFRDFWIAKPGKEGTKLDWEATWRNWVRREGPVKGNGAGHPSRQESLEDRNRRVAESWTPPAEVA